jgi:hypothetical protein
VSSRSLASRLLGSIVPSCGGVVGRIGYAMVMVADDEGCC